MITVSPLVVMEHVVDVDETLAEVAARYGVTAVTLLMLNNLAESPDLRPGQQLLVPVMLAYLRPQVVVPETAALYSTLGGCPANSILPSGMVMTVQAQTVNSRWIWVTATGREGWVETAVVRPFPTNSDMIMECF